MTSTFPRWQGDSIPAFVFELCRQLAGEFDVWVLAPHAAGACIAENIDGLRVVRFRYAPIALETLAYGGGMLANLRQNRWRWLMVIPFMLFQWIAAFRLVARERIGLVHAHWLIPQGVVAACLFRRRAKLLVTAHGSDLSGLTGGLSRLLKRWALRRADGVTVVSATLRDRALDLGAAPSCLTVAPMGVDVRRRFVPGPEATRSATGLLFVGRLVREKGIESLLRAMPAVLTACPAATLTVVGSGPLEEDLRILCSELGLTAHVTFVGALANEYLPDYYRRAAITVIPSLDEGYGLVCVEAMACACPVAASDLPALRGILEDGAYGRLFQAGDEADLADCVAGLLDESAGRRALGEAGRRQAERTGGWEASGNLYAGLLHGLAKCTQ
jgi:glycosyltransferase involved in cell wall biosynthesis